MSFRVGVEDTSLMIADLLIQSFITELQVTKVHNNDGVTMMF